MLGKTFLVVCAFVLVVCERQGRLFSFEFEDRDITVDLDFSIPFLTIPIKNKNTFGDSLPTININPASLALGGAVVLGTAVLMPLLMKNYALQSEYPRYSRMLENTEFSADAVLSFANQMLADGRGLRGCTLRVACWSAQTHHAFPLKIMSHILNNKLLSMIVNSTVIEDAMLSGRNGRDCESYAPCPLQKRHMPFLLNNLDAFTKFYDLS